MVAGTGWQKAMAATGCSEEEAKRLSFIAIDQICTAFEAITESAQPQLPERFRLNRTSVQPRWFEFWKPKGEYMDFGFIPDLSAMTAAEFGDIMQLTSTPESAIENMVDIAAIMFRPITNRIGVRYEVQSYDSDKTRMYIDYIEQLPFRFYLGGRAFFLCTRNELLMAIPEFSRKQAAKIRWQTQHQRLKQKIKGILSRSTAR